MAAWSSRDRMLAALSCREPDHVPCCFSAFQILRRQCTDQAEFVQRQMEMGLDAQVAVSTPPLRHDPRVRIKEWRKDEPGEPYPILHKEYETPAGTLHTAVSRSEDWPWGNHVPFMDDFLIPRSRKFLMTPDDSLDALRYLLAAPTKEDVAAFRDAARQAKALAAERDLLTVGYYGMGGDLACWLSGMQELMVLTVDEPEFVRGLLATIEEWNRQRMAAVLEEGVDLFVRRAWYENADTWSPRAYREFILPSVCRDADLAHEAGAKFGYLMSCASMPLLDLMMDAGVDVLIGIDPAQDRTMDLALLKEKTKGRMCLWGGVCGYLTVECGTPDDIREQVRRSMSILAPGGGFILAPVTNVREDTERAWENVRALIDTWRELRGQPAVDSTDSEDIPEAE
jgi:uroporphyrinogen-III decarboxylase